MRETPFQTYLPPDHREPSWAVDIIAGGIGRVSAGSSYPLPGHPADHRLSWEHGRTLDEWQLIVIAAGRGVLETRRGAQACLAPCLLVVAPRVWHRYRPDPAIGWEERWIACRGPLPDRLGRDGILEPHAPLSLAGAPGVQAALDAALAAMRRAGSGTRGEAAAAAGLLLARVRSLRLDAEAVPGDAALHAAAAELAAAGPAGLSLAALARRCRLSPAQFRRRFAALHGCPPRAWHAQALAARAQRLLADPQARVQDVAAALGFDDPFHFSRRFAAIVGASPRAWRQQSMSRR